MRKIINNRVYDTGTAKFLGEYTYSNRRDFNFFEEALYQKKTGEFFLYGEGGPMSKYSISTGQNQWSGGEKIMPLSFEMARQWAENHLDAEDYENIFGTVSEDEEVAALQIQIPRTLHTLIKAKAAEANTSVQAYVADILEKELG